MIQSHQERTYSCWELTLCVLTERLPWVADDTEQELQQTQGGRWIGFDFHQPHLQKTYPFS